MVPFLVGEGGRGWETARSDMSVNAFSVNDGGSSISLSWLAHVCPSCIDEKEKTLSLVVRKLYGKPIEHASPQLMRLINLYYVIANRTHDVGDKVFLRGVELINSRKMVIDEVKCSSS